MDFTKTKHKVLGVERTDNQYNKDLKWVVKSVLVGITEEEDAKLIPLEERQVHEDWHKTRKEAEERVDFYNKYYKSDWSSGSWKPINH